MKPFTWKASFWLFLLVFLSNHGFQIQSFEAFYASYILSLLAQTFYKIYYSLFLLSKFIDLNYCQSTIWLFKRNLSLCYFSPIFVLFVNVHSEYLNIRTDIDVIHFLNLEMVNKKGRFMFTLFQNEKFEHWLLIEL